MTPFILSVSDFEDVVDPNVEMLVDDVSNVPAGYLATRTANIKFGLAVALPIATELFS